MAGSHSENDPPLDHDPEGVRCRDAPNKAHAAGAGISECYALKRSHKMHVYREVAEWLKAHAWKVCIPKGIEGSNPFLSAILK